ncbi:MAG: GTP 3',8-cyclase MoaA [Candidatus Thermoplasmatota archaeon]
MEDPYGREMTNIRLALTQRCNLGCFYCHREGEEKKLETKLDLREVRKIVKTASDLGMHKVKFSGGEPLLHPDIEEIIEFSSEYMEDVSLTTNGVLLKSEAKGLKEEGLDRVNVSLDTVDPKTYQKITGKRKLSDVKEGIRRAVEVGLFPVKVNMLLMRGLNHEEVWDMVDWVSDLDAILQVIELTSNEEEIDREFYQEHHVPLKNLASELEERAVRTEKRRMHARKKYFLEEPEVEVELVRTMHNSTFCDNCTRLRVTSNGELKPCLLRTDNHVSIREELKRDEGIKDKFIEAIERREPYWCE